MRKNNILYVNTVRVSSVCVNKQDADFEKEKIQRCLKDKNAKQNNCSKKKNVYRKLLIKNKNYKKIYEFTLFSIFVI